MARASYSTTPLLRSLVRRPQGVILVIRRHKFPADRSRNLTFFRIPETTNDISNKLLHIRLRLFVYWGFRARRRQRSFCDIPSVLPYHHDNLLFPAVTRRPTASFVKSLASRTLEPIPRVAATLSQAASRLPTPTAASPTSPSSRTRTATGRRVKPSLCSRAEWISRTPKHISSQTFQNMWQLARCSGCDWARMEVFS